jgi:hypothetical protein
MTNSLELDSIVHFLNAIGIQCEYRQVAEDTFLPGISIEAGRLIIDPERLRYPGDLLHEAGHIAVVPAADRPGMYGNIEPDKPAESLELGAVLWSFAALHFIGLDPTVVFHEAGYKGESKWLIEQFESGTYIGLPLLQWMGLAYDASTAAKMNVKPFPFMLKWLRD